METVREDYRGYEISYIKPPLMGNQFQVNVASESLSLLNKLNHSDRVISGSNMDDAVIKAKRTIDQILG